MIRCERAGTVTVRSGGVSTDAASETPITVARPFAVAMLLAVDEEVETAAAAPVEIPTPEAIACPTAPMDATPSDEATATTMA
jgi:hypothetical protein